MVTAAQCEWMKEAAETKKKLSFINPEKSRELKLYLLLYHCDISLFVFV